MRFAKTMDEEMEGRENIRRWVGIVRTHVVEGKTGWGHSGNLVVWVMPLAANPDAPLVPSYLLHHPAAATRALLPAHWSHAASTARPSAPTSSAP